MKRSEAKRSEARGDATDPDAMRRGSTRPAREQARLRAEKKTDRARPTDGGARDVLDPTTFPTSELGETVRTVV